LLSTLPCTIKIIIHRQRWPQEERADLAAANLHTLEVANAHYVNEQVAAEASDLNLGTIGLPGDFIRGLGKCTLAIPTLPGGEKRSCPPLFPL